VYSTFTMVVRMRHTRAHRDNRRSHHALENPSVTLDVKSGVPHLRHRASLVTGEYRGRKVIDVTAKLEKKAKKASERKAEGR
jgi:ribosomal protein L32